MASVLRVAPCRWSNDQAGEAAQGDPGIFEHSMTALVPMKKLDIVALDRTYAGKA